MYKELVNPFQMIVSCNDKKTGLLYHVMDVENLVLLRLSIQSFQIHQTFALYKCVPVYLQHALLYFDHVLQQQGVIFEKTILQVSFADGLGSEKVVFLTEQNILLQDRKFITLLTVLPNAKNNSTL